MDSFPDPEIPANCINFVDINSVCRVCLTEQKPLIPLHEILFTKNLNSKGSVENVTINEVFLKHCNVVVHVYDQKPQQICESCLNAMGMAYNFFELFLQSNTILENILKRHQLEQGKQAVIQNCSTPESAKLSTNPLDILPSPEKKRVNIFNKKDANLSCPVAYIENFSEYVDKGDIIILPENVFFPENGSPVDNPLIITKTDIPDIQLINNEHEEVPSINERALQERCTKDEEILEGSKQKQRIIETSQPYFINDPTASLKDHTYTMRWEKYLLKPRKQLMKRRKPPRLKKIKSKPIKPVVESRKELNEKRKKFEQETDTFRCRFCSKPFQGIAKVLEHLTDEHPLIKRCILCPNIIKKPEYMKYHVAAHSKLGLVCRICRLYFENEESLERHKTEIDHSALLDCQKCNKTFRSLSKRREHMEGVHEQINNKFKYQCSQCGLFLKWKCGLRRHENNHQQELSKRKVFLCQICANRFTSKNALELHVKVVHEGQTHLINKKKNKKKKVVQNGQKHRKKREMKIETYVCDYCSRTFTQKHAFSKHCLSHPDYKSVKCSYCPIVFEDVQSYKEHRELEHNSFVCQTCNKGFPNQWVLTAHLKSHIKNHRCDVCNYRCSSIHILETHKRVHTGERPFKCEYCDKTFTQSAPRNRHIMGMHTQKNHKCKLCGKTFDVQYGLRAHMRSHTGEKPFSCIYCDKSFRDTVSRHKHVKREHPDQMKDFIAYKKKFQDQESKEALHGKI